MSHKKEYTFLLIKHLKQRKTNLFLYSLGKLVKFKTEIITKVMRAVCCRHSESDVIDCSRCSFHKYSLATHTLYYT